MQAPLVRRLATAALAAAASLALLPAGTALAAAGPTQGVTVYLAPHDRAALYALAHTPGLSWSARQAELARLRPTAADRAAAAGRLTGLGLRVSRSGGWTVSARGPADRIRALFGSARSVSPHTHVAHALPYLPAALRGLVSAAFGGDENRPAGVKHDWTTTSGNPGYNGTQLRAAFGMTKSLAGNGDIVASVQLSNFYPTDLSDYAQAEGLSTNPVASGQFSEVPVDGGTSDLSGQDEFALDQEALLAVAPGARQRAYVAPQTTSTGSDPLIDAFYAIGDDAASPTLGNRIVAATTSWGTCEDTSSGAASFFQTFEDALAYVLASGVTVFAASGDTGSGCPTGTGTFTTLPSYPASSPSVVGVGGVSLTQPTSTTWHQHAWGCATLSSWADYCGAGTTPTSYCESSSSSNGCAGGGVSGLFGRPTWQPATGSSPTRRTVPDIAGLADPATGFGIVDSNGYVNLAGGTSLASPESAGMFTDELMAAGRTWGVGDIHSALYGAPWSDFTDVNDGVYNGGYHAANGYDLVTGRGTPRWDSLAAALLPGDGSIAATVGTNHAAYLLRNGSWTSLGGYWVGPVTALSRHGIDYVTALGSNHLVYVRTAAKTWAPVSSSGTCTDQQTSIEGADFVAVCLGSNHHAYLGGGYLSDGTLPTVSSWVDHGGYFLSAPAATLVDGDPTLVGTGGNDSLYESHVAVSSTGSAYWTSWSALPYKCLTRAGVATDGSVTALDCVGTNHALYTVVRTGGSWPSAVSQGGSWTKAPAIVVAPSRAVTAYETGSNNALYRKAIWPSAGSWASAGGSWLYGPGATATTVSTLAPVAAPATVTTSTRLGASASSVTSGSPVTFTATVVPWAGQNYPYGSVTFTDTTNGLTLGTALLNDHGVTTLTTTALPAGSDSVTATYTNGGYGFVASTSPAVTVSVS